MFIIRFTLIAVALVAVVNAYGRPPKNSFIPDKYEKQGESEKDVLYVKGQPVDDGKDEQFDDLDKSSQFVSGSYGPAKKIKEIKEDENLFSIGKGGGGGYGGGKPVHEKKSYDDESYKVEEEKKEIDYPSKQDEPEPVVTKEETVKHYGHGSGPKKHVIKEETYSEETKPIEGGYGSPSVGGGYGGSKPIQTETYGEDESKVEKIPEEKIEEKYDEPIEPKGGVGGGYGGSKIIKTVKESTYGSSGYTPYEKKELEDLPIKEEVIDKPIITSSGGGGYGSGGGYGGGKKVIETVKETNYGEVIKPKGGYGGGGYGGGYGGKKVVESFEQTENNYGPEGGSVTTFSTQACNKMMDGIFEKLQPKFYSHMKETKINRFSPVAIGGWAKVRLYDGKFDKVGQLCRTGDFQVLPQGENVIIRGMVTVPDPALNFCGDAYLYNRVKVRATNLRLCAKEATFRLQMIVNKKSHNVQVDDLEPIDIHGFRVEDDKGHRGGALAWPFSRINERQMYRQRRQFVSTLRDKLCGDFREYVQKPEISEEIIRLV